jgi:hypothetical protein
MLFGFGAHLAGVDSRGLSIADDRLSADDDVANVARVEAIEVRRERLARERSGDRSIEEDEIDR